MRRAHGFEEPFDIKVWCLVMNGWFMADWCQDRLRNMVELHETAKIMKELDPSIELVACGSSSLFYADLW